MVKYVNSWPETRAGKNIFIISSKDSSKMSKILEIEFCAYAELYDTDDNDDDEESIVTNFRDVITDDGSRSQNSSR